MKKIYNFFISNLKRKDKKEITVLSLILTLLTIFGTSYITYGDGNLVFKNMFHFILSILAFIIIYCGFKFLIKYIFDYLDSEKLYIDKKKKSKFREKFDKHPFLFSMIFIIICWMPYIISFYPCILAPDPVYQIMQFFGIENKFANSFYSPLFDASVTIITNHHPVLHTLILGSCVKIGQVIGNVNFGLFIYSFVQILVLSSVLSATLRYMKKIDIHYKLRKLSLLMYALFPMFPLYAMNPVKDVMFTCFVMIYILFLVDLVKNKDKKLNIKYYLFLSLDLILMMLFRHNGIHLIILSLPFLIVINKVNRKGLIAVLILMVSFNVTFNKVILPYFHIIPSSIKEQLSIPFQQTARYVKYHKNEITTEEYHAINNVLNISNLGERYNPNNSDPVKDYFNATTTQNKTYLENYFRVWFNAFFKHPTVYIDATINNCYGYFYPFKTNWYIYYKSVYNNQDDIRDYGFDYHFNSLVIPRKILSTFGQVFQYIPVIGWPCNIGINSWTLFLVSFYLVYKKKTRGLVALLPSLVSLLICIASPVNCYYRYVLPFVFANPLIIMFVLDYTRGGKKDE